MAAGILPVALFAGRGDGLLVWEFTFAGDGGDDLAAVEAAVFDEDARGVVAADDHTRKINSGDVAFEGLGIDGGFLIGAGKAYAEAFEKIEIGMIAREREDLAGCDGLPRCRHF